MLAALPLLEEIFNQLKEKRENHNGFVQGCQRVSKDLKEKLDPLNISIKRCLIKSPYGPFENIKTNDYIYHHYFLLSDNLVFDPFVSPQPINFKEYLSFYTGDDLHIGLPNQDGSYHFIPIGIF